MRLRPEYFNKHLYRFYLTLAQTIQTTGTFLHAKNILATKFLYIPR